MELLSGILGRHSRHGTSRPYCKSQTRKQEDAAMAIYRTNVLSAPSSSAVVLRAPNGTLPREFGDQ